jgi:hypothetical protein
MVKTVGFHRKHGAIPNENLFYLDSLPIIKVTSKGNERSGVKLLLFALKY